MSANFQSLPPEILRLIRTELDHPSLMSFRLVSKAMNDFAEPKVFESAKIDITEYSPPFIIQGMLSTLASGRGPIARWTQRLYISNLVQGPVIKSQQLWWNKEAMLNCQNEFLIPAIRSLKNVRLVEFFINNMDPCADVISTISQIPTLKDISISFRAPFNDTPRSLEEFSDLRAITLSYFLLTDAMLSVIRGLFEASPSLQTLSLSPRPSYPDNILNSNSSAIPVSAVLHPTPSLIPNKLTKLTLTGDKFFIDSSSFALLRSLVHLEIGSSRNVEWKALSQAQLKLEHLSTLSLTSPLLQYLLSYAGLKYLEIELKPNNHDPSASVMEDNVAPQIFRSVMPHHRDTLQCLSFKNGRYGARIHKENSPWLITEEYMESIFLCRALEHFTVFYYCPLSTSRRNRRPSVIDLPTLVSRFTENLPDLRSLKLLLLGNAGNHTQLMSRLTEYLRSMVQPSEAQPPNPRAQPSLPSGSPRTPVLSLTVEMGASLSVFDRNYGVFMDVHNPNVVHSQVSHWIV